MRHSQRSTRKKNSGSVNSAYHHPAADSAALAGNPGCSHVATGATWRTSRANAIAYAPAASIASATDDPASRRVVSIAPSSRGASASSTSRDRWNSPASSRNRSAIIRSATINSGTAIHARAYSAASLHTPSATSPRASSAIGAQHKIASASARVAALTFRPARSKGAPPTSTNSLTTTSCAPRSPVQSRCRGTRSIGSSERYRHSGPLYPSSVRSSSRILLATYKNGNDRNSPTNPSTCSHASKLMMSTNPGR